jgi:hypothetical protein
MGAWLDEFFAIEDLSRIDVLTNMINLWLNKGLGFLKSDSKILTLQQIKNLNKLDLKRYQLELNVFQQTISYFVLNLQLDSPFSEQLQKIYDFEEQLLLLSSNVRQLLDESASNKPVTKKPRWA